MSKEKEKKEDCLYTTYHIEVAFRNGIAGSIPMESHLIEAHIDKYSLGVSNALQGGKAVEGVVTEEAIAAYKRGATTIFRLNSKGQPIIRDFMVKAMMLKAARLVPLWGSKGGLLQQTIQDGGVVPTEEIPVIGEFTLTQRPVAPEAARGGRQASIAVFEVVNGGKAVLDLAVINNDCLPEETLRKVWTVAQNCGLGGFRHLGYGMFGVTKLEKVR